MMTMMVVSITLWWKNLVRLPALVCAVQEVLTKHPAL